MVFHLPEGKGDPDAGDELGFGQSPVQVAVHELDLEPELPQGGSHQVSSNLWQGKRVSY